CVIESRFYFGLGDGHCVDGKCGFIALFVGAVDPFVSQRRHIFGNQGCDLPRRLRLFGISL
ncbi:hypothetical protein U1Q18_050620, partial [Sarracenia purpurea var. burkii]